MATKNFQLGGGTLRVTDPDPLQVRIALAQLAKAEAEPGIEQGRLDVERLNAQRALEAARQQYNLGKSGQVEEGRYHTGTLQQAQNALGEETRFHTGQLGESVAERQLREKNAAETTRANAYNDVLMHAGPQLESQFPGITARIASGANPEIARIIATATAEKEAETARQQVAGYTKPEQVSALTKTLPTDKANLLWNAYKTAHPDQLGPPAPAATVSQGTTVPTTPTTDVLRTAGVGPEATFSPVPLSSVGTAAPTSVATLDRGVAKPSMGVVNPVTGGTTPIPGASADYTGGSGETTALNLPPLEGQLASSPSRGNLIRFPAVVPSAGTQPVSTVAAPATNVGETAPTPLSGGGSEYGPPQVDVDALLRSVVGAPTEEDLRQRRRSAQPAVLTPFRTNQY